MWLAGLSIKLRRKKASLFFHWKFIGGAENPPKEENNPPKENDNSPEDVKNPPKEEKNPPEGDKNPENIIEEPEGNIDYYLKDGKGHIMLTGIKLTGDWENLEKFYTERYDLNGGKYTVTFPDSLGILYDKMMRVNDELFSSIQVVNNGVTRNTSIVIYAKDRLLCESISSPMVTTLKLYLSIPLQKIRMTTRILLTKVILMEELCSKWDNGDKIFAKESMDEVAICVGNYTGYNVMRLTGPDRFVIDIPGRLVQGPLQKD